MHYLLVLISLGEKNNYYNASAQVYIALKQFLFDEYILVKLGNSFVENKVIELFSTNVQVMIPKEYCSQGVRRTCTPCRFIAVVMWKVFLYFFHSQASHTRSRKKQQEYYNSEVNSLF